MLIAFFNTCEPSSGGIGIKLKKAKIKFTCTNINPNGTRIDPAMCIPPFSAITPAFVNAIITIASNKFIAGPASAINVSSRLAFRRLSIFTGTGFPQPMINPLNAEFVIAR